MHRMHRISLRSFLGAQQRLSSTTPPIVASVAAAAGVGCTLWTLSAEKQNQRCPPKSDTNHRTRSLLYINLPISTCTAPEQDEDDSDDDFSEPARYEQSLAFHRSLLDEYRSKWEYVPEINSYGGNGTKSVNRSTSTPTSFNPWPKSIPTTPEQVKILEYDLKYAAPGKYRDDLQFRIAVYCMNNSPSNTDASSSLDHFDSRRALRSLQELALAGHADSQCMLGIIFREGTADIDPDPVKALVWFQRAAGSGNHAQACYEMGVALYTGEGGVPEQEGRAVEYFERAASLGHAAAAYMLGDCLLDGVGVIRDRAEALEWLVAAGEMGHRGARSRVLAVLENTADESGVFTDGSRQSFQRRAADVVPEEKKWTEEDLKRLVTLEKQYTIGGGTRNPVILERRKSVVLESREQPNEAEEHPLES